MKGVKKLLYCCEQRLSTDSSAKIDKLKTSPFATHPVVEHSIARAEQSLASKRINVVFSHYSGLDRFVASSAGALQKFWIRCEVYILEFGECEERRLTQGMSEKKIGLFHLYNEKIRSMITSS